MSLLNGVTHSVVIDGDNCEIRVSTYHLAVLQEHFGSIDALHEAIERRGPFVSVLITALATGAIKPADLRGDQSILLGKLDDFGPRLGSSAKALADAAFGAFTDAMATKDQQEEMKVKAVDPTKPVVLTPSTS